MKFPKEIYRIAVLILTLTIPIGMAGRTPQSAGAENASLRPLWAAQTARDFPTALQAEIGFSFTFDGNKVGPAAPAGWQVSTQGKSGGVTETTFRHASGLTVVRSTRRFPESEAFEYTLRFKNENNAVLPALADVNALDLTFAGDIVKGVSVVSSGGGQAEPVFPPKDFALGRTYFGPMMPINGQITLTTTNGKSSRGNLPFFFVENLESSTGIFVGIGWTGQWKATIAANFDKDTLHLQGGMTGIDLRLEPGEEISSPSILVGAYRGPFSAGANVLRRLIRDEYNPKVGGQPLVAPVMYTTWFDIGTELDDPLSRKLVDVAAEIGQEIFEVDAGWYKGTPTVPYTDMMNTWPAISNSLGNWELGEDRTRFPTGLRALADDVRSKGMQFGLWFEPERTGPESLLAKQHPDWIIYAPKRKWGVVNFGKPEVQEYFEKILDRYINEYGLHYVRWDNNSELLDYWTDPPGRGGITQIRHLEGVHRVEEWILEHHPNLIFENCAGGGQRVDLQSLARRQTIWISDQTMDPDIVRFHLEGLNHFVTGNRQMVAFAAPISTYQKPGFNFPDLAFQSYFGGAFGTAGRLQDWPEGLKLQVRKHVDAYKKVRRFLADDYYLLKPQARTLEGWEGWQFHDPKTQEGFVQAFRTRSPEATQKLVLHSLDANARYEFSDVYSGKSFKVSGNQLISEGLKFDLPQNSSRVLLYRRIP